MFKMCAVLYAPFSEDLLIINDVQVFVLNLALINPAMYCLMNDKGDGWSE